jgi:hypothetical protein
MHHHNSPAASREIDRPRDPARVAQPHFPQLVAKRADMRHSYFLRPVSTQQLADPQEIGLMPGRKAANFAAAQKFPKPPSACAASRKAGLRFPRSRRVPITQERRRRSLRFARRQERDRRPQKKALARGRD